MTQTPLWEGWHVLKANRCLGREPYTPVEVGVPLHATGPLETHTNGMHATQDILYLMSKTTGPWICRVHLLGKRIDDDDQSCARTRVVQWMVHADRVARIWAGLCVWRAFQREHDEGRRLPSLWWEALRTLLTSTASLCPSTPARVPVLSPRGSKRPVTGKYTGRGWLRKSLPGWHRCPDQPDRSEEAIWAYHISREKRGDAAHFSRAEIHCQFERSLLSTRYSERMKLPASTWNAGLALLAGLTTLAYEEQAHLYPELDGRGGHLLDVERRKNGYANAVSCAAKAVEDAAESHGRDGTAARAAEEAWQRTLLESMLFAMHAAQPGA